jgi:hypothetical protein
MALVAFDGFDHYSTDPTDLLSRRSGGLQWNAENQATYVVPGRNSFGMAIQLGQTAFLQGTLVTPIAGGFIGFAAKLVTGNLNNPPSLRLVDLHGGTQAQVSVVFDPASGSIRAYRGGYDDGSGTDVLLGSTANNVFTNNAWNYVEIAATINNAAGAVTVRLNGAQVLNITGVDTQFTANAWFEAIWFRGPTSGSNDAWQIDDFYVSNTTAGSGAVPFNAFIGDARVWSLYATGDATTQQWTPLTVGTPNWQEVSETRNDGDASYNSTASVGARDNFHFQQLPTAVQVLAVQVTGSYRRDDAGPRTVNQHLTSGGTDVVGASYVLPNTYVYCCDFWTTDPHTSAAWTVAAVNAVAAGYGLVS